MSINAQSGYVSQFGAAQGGISCGPVEPIWTTRQIFGCSDVTLYDAALADNASPDNNELLTEVFDSCGNKVLTDTKYNLANPYGTTYPFRVLVNYAPSRYLTVPTTAGGCYGAWNMRVTLTQTFQDGHTLTVQDITAYPKVYYSKGAADAERVDPQATPIGGPVGSREQLGGCGEQRSTHAQATDYPVDTASGNFWHTFNDLTYPGRAAHIEATRTYNSLNAAQNSRFGYGWSDSYSHRLEIDTASVILHGCSGSLTRFTRATNGTWTAPPRATVTLQPTADGSWLVTSVTGETRRFDTQGRLIALGDGSGEADTVLTYPAADRAVIKDEAGRTLTYTSVDGLVRSISDSSNRTITFDYDTSGDLVRTTDARGGVWTFTYDQQHRLLTMRSPGAQDRPSTAVVTNEYDSAGRVAWQTDQLGRKTTFEYTSNPDATVVTSPSGTKTLHQYSDGLHIKQIDDYQSPNEAIWVYRYDPRTLGRTLVLDPSGDESRATYTNGGDLESTTDPTTGQVTRYTYDSNHRIKTVTSPRKVGGTAVTTTYTYTPAGELASVSTPLLNDSGATTDTATWTYGHADTAHPTDLTSITDPTGRKTEMTYDSFGNVTSTRGPPTPALPNGALTTMQVDSHRGLVTASTSPRGNLPNANAEAFTTTYVHDRLDRLREIRKPGWTSSTPDRDRLRFEFDADSQLTEQATGPGLVTTYRYDDAGQIDRAQANGGSPIASTYDADGRLKTRTDGSANGASFEYNNRGHLTAVKDALGRQTTYTHDLLGRVLTAKDAAGRSTAYAYNSAGELTGITYPGSSTPGVSNITYDSDGRVTGYSDALGASNLTYDSLGRLTKRTEGRGKTFSYTYDLTGRQKSLTYPDGLGTTTNTYDPAGNLTQVDDFTGQATKYDYDADGNITARHLPNGISTETTFNNQSLATAMRYIDTRNQNRVLGSLTYTRDGAGRTSTVTSTGQLAGNDHSYEYDSNGRLATVDGKNTAYDAAGNLSRAADGSVQTYNSARELQTREPAQAVTYVGGTTATSASATTLSLTAPAATQPDDVAVIAVTVPSGKSTDTVPGFTKIGEVASTSTRGGVLQVFTSRTVTAGQNLAVNFKGKFDKTAALTVYRGVSAAASAVTLNNTAKATATSITTPAAATPARGARVLITGSNGAPNTWTFPTGNTKRHERTGTTTDVAIADQIAAQDLAAANIAATHNGTATELLSALLQLKPASHTYQHDAAGYRTQQSAGGAATALTHDSSGALRQHGATSYGYDATGLRTSATGPWGNRAYAWNTNTSVPQLLSDGQAAFIYGPDGNPIERVTTAGTKRFLLQDNTDSTRLLTGSDGAITGTYAYNAYGASTTMTGDAADNPLRFDSQYQDPGSGLIYLRARNLDPTTNGFISVDPLEAMTGDGYTYANNDPVNLSDPTGLCPICAIAVGALVGGGLDLGMQALTNTAQGCDPFAQINWSSVALSAAVGATPVKLPPASSKSAKAGALVRYDAQAASRNLLGQVGEDYARTPSGYTISAHAAERIVHGAAGRSPTTLDRIDDILNNPTKTAIRPDGSLRVFQGKDWVAVRDSGPIHIITVMVR